MEWEYYTLKTKLTGFWGGSLDTAKLDVSMNELGSQGWELVSVVPIAAAYGNTKEITAIFKRPIEKWTPET